jgi:hypothetical protein
MRFINIFINSLCFVVGKTALSISRFVVWRTSLMCMGDGPNSGPEWMIAILFWAAVVLAIFVL